MSGETNMPNRVSDEEFCEMLMGHSSPRCCPDDAADVDALHDALRSYRTESLLWAERRSAAMPSLVPAARRRAWWGALPQWSLAAVAVMTVAVAAVHFHHASREAGTVETPVAVTQRVEAAATPKQLAEDNALLNSIDAAVNAGSGLPVNALGLDDVRSPGRARGSME